MYYHSLGLAAKGERLHNVYIIPLLHYIGEGANKNVLIFNQKYYL